jgi:hypothetical protein
MVGGKSSSSNGGQWGGVLHGCIGDDIFSRVQLPVVLNPSLHLLPTVFDEIARGGLEG